VNFITGKHLPRRTFLRGVGATVALPFLESMLPARGSRAYAAAATQTGKTPLVCIEEVHGLPGCNNWGATKHLFAPEIVGRDFTLVADNPLTTIDAFRSHMTIVSNTDVRNAEAFLLPEIGGDHFRSSAVFLTQSHPKQTQGSDIWAGTSLDQMYAKKFGQDTPLPSMQFCIENLDQAGGCTYNYSCAYTDSISWASPNEPLPMIRDPRIAFDLLFGAGATPEDRAARLMTRRSILDWVGGEVERVRRQLGAGDRARLDRYMDNVREVERRIQAVEAHNRSGETRDMPNAPAGVPDSFSEHMKLLFDLQVIALQTGMTRVVSFKIGRDAQNRVFPESGSSQPFHPASHHGNREERIMEYNKICKYRMSQLAYLLDKMKNATVEGDQNLLDKSLVIWGSPMADSNIHSHRRCPLVLLGHAGGHLTGGMHLKAEDGTPMANVMLTLLHNLGMDEVKTFGDSNGEFSLSAPPSMTVAGH
jgi:uncharacterized protein DUF1552